MLHILWIALIANVLDMYLTKTFVFGTNDFIELNPIIESSGMIGLFIVKAIAAIFMFGLYVGGQIPGDETWKFNAALLFVTVIYSALMVWWAIALLSI